MHDRGSVTEWAAGITAQGLAHACDRLYMLVSGAPRPSTRSSISFITKLAANSIRLCAPCAGAVLFCLAALKPMRAGLQWLGTTCRQKLKEGWSRIALYTAGTIR